MKAARRSSHKERPTGCRSGALPDEYGEWYRRIVETSLEGIWVVDESGKIIYANDRMAEMLGLSPEEIQGRTIFDFTSPETSRATLKFFAKREMKGKSDARLRRKDGTDLWVLVSSSPIFKEKGEFIGSLNMATDITERKKTERRLNFLASIIQAIPEAVCGIDLNGTILSWNEGAQSLLGYTAKDILGKPVTLILPAGLAGRELVHCMDTLNEKGSFTGYESVRITRDGNELPVEITAVAMRDKNHRVSGYASIMRDISPRKRYEESLRKAVKNAEDEKAKTEAVIEAIGDGIRVLDRDFRIVYENRIHKDLLGSHKGEHCYSAYRQQEEICEGCGIAKSFRDGKIRRLERIVPTRNRTAHLEITASPVKDSSGKIVAGIEVIRDVTDRRKADQERERLIRELTEALEKIKTLRGLLHTCAWCRKIRDSKGVWNRAEIYIERHSEAKFTHGICPDCLKKYSPEAYHDLINSPGGYEKLLETYRGTLEPGDDGEGP